MRVLLITYYWPPAGGVAVQRWMKFANLLHKREGIELVVYTAKNPDYPEVDSSLMKEVQGIQTWKQNIFEPYSLFRFFTGKRKTYLVKQEFAASSNKGFLDKLAIYIRGNFFIPDARRFWVKPSIRCLKNKWKNEGGFDCVITNGTPHSVHLIALGLKRHFSFRWVADFRDPWTKVDYFNDLLLSSCAERKHRRMEKAVLETADHVVTVSPTWALDFRDLGAKSVTCITNGFDPADFPEFTGKPDKHFTIAHVGNLNKRRNKPVFWKTIRRLCDEVPGFRNDVRIRLIGPVDDGVNAMVNLHGLQELVQLTGTVSHDEAIKEMQRAQLLLLLVGDDKLSEGRIPAKVFEYMAAKRPIFAIAPDKSDVKSILERARAGTCIMSTDEEEMYREIQQRYNYYCQNIPFETGADLRQFTRQALADQMEKIIRGTL